MIYYTSFHSGAPPRLNSVCEMRHAVRLESAGAVDGGQVEAATDDKGVSARARVEGRERVA